MNPIDIENIERATIAAVVPEALEECDGWLLPFDSGTVNRARSAVPLSHAAADQGLLERMEASDAAHGMPAVFRLATDPCFDPLRQELSRRGYQADKPTLVQIGSARLMRQVSAQPPADIADAPDAAWTALFVGEGFDPVDGASRVKTLSRARDTLYASVREHGKVVAAGAAAFGHGWCSVHGMRTDAACRGRGLAGRVLAGLADAALQRGMERIFLQVEAGNASAQALYRRAGFQTAWRYAYWRRPA
jgi:ribosomal protein S18 acetylase RimI-like enzyme